MNRVKAGDAWARVSTKRYGSRLDGNEARIEILSVSGFPLSLVVWFLFVILSLSLLLVHIRTSLPISLYVSLRSYEPSRYYQRVVCSI